jgi:hypothetical protein
LTHTGTELASVATPEALRQVLQKIELGGRQGGAVVGSGGGDPVRPWPERGWLSTAR